MQPPLYLPVNCGMHLVAVFLRRERIEHHAAIGQLKDHVLLRRYGRPFHLEEVQRERKRDRVLMEQVSVRRRGGGEGGSQLTWKCAKAARTKMACIIKQSAERKNKRAGDATPSRKQEENS